MENNIAFSILAIKILGVTLSNCPCMIKGRASILYALRILRARGIQTVYQAVMMTTLRVAYTLHQLCNQPESYSWLCQAMCCRVDSVMLILWSFQRCGRDEAENKLFHKILSDANLDIPTWRTETLSEKTTY